MTNKHKGGRGLKAETPYERLSFTMPPHLKAYLDAQAEGAGVSRSEMLARILEDHQAQKQQPKPAAIPEGESTTPPLRGTSTARTAPKKKEAARTKQTDSLPERVEVVTSLIERKIRGQLKWTKERYIEVENILRHTHYIIKKIGEYNYITDDGIEVSWRTVLSLVNQGILREVKSD
jgi:hypothetical protein